MTDGYREPFTARVVAVLRVTVVVVGLVSLTLGYLGLRAYLRGPGGVGFSHAPADLVYYDMALFLLQAAPLDRGGPFPWALEVARFSAPAVTAYALVEVAAVLFARQLRQARLLRYRNHAVVCGAGRAAGVLARRLRENGLRVVTVVPGGVRWPERAAGTTVLGDPRSARTLHAAGVARASVVYACLDGSADNVAVALAAGLVGRARPGRLKVYAMVGDVELCAALRARRWSLADPAGPRLEFFNADELAAQAVVRRDPLVYDERPPEVVVVGTGAFGRSVLVELVRQWLLRGGRGSPDGRRVQAVLVGPQAAQTARMLTDRFPFLGETCELVAFDGTLEELLERRAGARLGPPHRLYLCHDDEERALKAALDTALLWRTPPESIVVRLDRLAGLGTAFRDRAGQDPMFDAIRGRLTVVDATEAGCDPLVIDDDLAERLARAIHDHYLREQTGRGAVLGSSPAVAPWEDLAEEYRAANRAQASDIGRKLASIGCTLAPRAGGYLEFAYTEGEVELLAMREHERWTAERTRAGWTRGPRRDDAARRHPDMVAWPHLPEDAREKDRQSIEALPRILADAGLMIVRMEPRRGVLSDAAPGPRPAL